MSAACLASTCRLTRMNASVLAGHCHLLGRADPPASARVRARLPTLCPHPDQGGRHGLGDRPAGRGRQEAVPGLRDDLQRHRTRGLGVTHRECQPDRQQSRIEGRPASALRASSTAHHQGYGGPAAGTCTPTRGDLAISQQMPGTVDQTPGTCRSEKGTCSAYGLYRTSRASLQALAA